MASLEQNHSLAAVRTALPAATIRTLTRNHGVVGRKRNVDIVAFVSSLVSNDRRNLPPSRLATGLTLSWPWSPSEMGFLCQTEEDA